MDPVLPQPTGLVCPFCKSRLLRFDSGYSEFDLSCEGCEAGFALEGEKVRSRRWDRQAARGVHQEFTRDQLEGS
jgi:hypothetical protein